MPQHIFLCWQSDIANAVGRSFVETCLERAIAELAADPMSQRGRDGLQTIFELGLAALQD